MTPQTEYKLDKAEADALAALAVMALPDRLAYIKQLRRDHGVAWVQNLFAQSLGVANSVADNCRDMAEFVAITQGEMHPHTAESINMPTMLGAAMGAKNAVGVNQSPICEGCAFRVGTHANQCVSTQSDVVDVELDAGELFQCHMEGLTENGTPTKACAGWAAFHKAARHEP